MADHHDRCAVIIPGKKIVFGAPGGRALLLANIAVGAGRWAASPVRFDSASPNGDGGNPTATATRV